MYRQNISNLFAICVNSKGTNLPNRGMVCYLAWAGKWVMILEVSFGFKTFCISLYGSLDVR